MNLAERRLLARRINHQYAGSGWCQRCNLNWQVTTHHTTWFLEDETGGHGVSPLCEDCWQECTVEERLVFYRLLWDEYAVESSDYEQEWPLVEKAVRAGK